jgi:hypothetical protein
MNSMVMIATTDGPELSEWEKIESALDALLKAMVEIDLRPRDDSKPPSKIRFVPVDLRGPVPTRREMQINQVLREPVRAACRNAIRLLGERIFELRGDDGMREMNDKVLRLDEQHFQRRASILNSAWDGIGHWVA